MKKETELYSIVTAEAKKVFYDKIKEYGFSFTLLSEKAYIDILLAKAYKLKNAEYSDVEDLYSIINYTCMALFDCERLPIGLGNEQDQNEALSMYDVMITSCYNMYTNRNEEYGYIYEYFFEETYYDMILMKVLRAKNILSGDSDSIDTYDCLVDLVNYAIMALMKKPRL